MSVEIIGNTSENYINIHPRFLREGQGVIRLLGTGATIDIDEQHISGSVFMTAGNQSIIKIGHACLLGSLSIHSLAVGSKILIGRNVSFNGSADIAAHETSTISIGNQCLIASGLSMSSSDVHMIYDRQTGERLNYAKDITVGDRTWIGGRVTVVKGAMIGSDSVVAIGSIVTKTFEANSLIGGVPARLIRKGIEWRP
jgi:acetyltransferase-like isoleucine patch superfamily enzyme